MNKFRQYLKDNGLNFTSFGKKVGLSHNYLSDISGGNKTPSLKTAKLIVDATNGEIPWDYWLSEEITRQPELRAQVALSDANP